MQAFWKVRPVRAVFGTSVLLTSVALIAAIVAGCSGNTTTATATTAATSTASIMLSDPATCTAPNGPFAHVYVTVTKVVASVNAGAGDDDPSFVNLTPGLSAQPKQIDLLGQATDGCFLANLGATQQLPPGKYQQIRIILADNGATLANNACNGSTNCVVLNDGSVHTLELSSESKTGIKIPSGQIANGGFNIAAGETKDLDIDFNTCVSIVREGNGTFRLKPVLHAGEVTATASSINGTVLDSATGNAVQGQVLVALEQKDTNGTDRIFMNTLTDASGRFVFCPLPTGTYDVVIVGISNTGVAYAPSVVTAVTTGSATGNILLYSPSVGTAAATLQGQVTAQNGASPSAGVAVDVQLSALERVSGGLVVTVPLLPTSIQPSAVLALATAAGGSCAAGVDCASYGLQLPAAAPYVGVAAAGGPALTQSAAASYVIDGLAFTPSAGGTMDCSPSALQSTAVIPVAGAQAPVQTLAFTGCS
jgi:Domain of unknown function (DUF4382)